MFEDIFKSRKMNEEKLLSYGFEVEDGKYCYRTDIMSDSFTLYITIDKNGVPDTSLTEKETGEEYVLYKTSAAGTFVGEIRAAIETVLSDISAKCYDFSVFKEEQTLRLIEYVRRKYGDELEFLWKKYDDNAIWRCKANQKWYAAVLTVKKSKLGIESDDKAEIIDLRIEPEKMAALIDNRIYFPGWHMNKKHWYTVILDGSVAYDELCRRIDESYLIAMKR